MRGANVELREGGRMAKRFLRMKELCSKVGLSRSQIYKLINDGQFPKMSKLGDRVSFWLEEEIDEWMGQISTRNHLNH